MSGPAGATRMQAAILPGGRLHLHDGPIDLIIVAEGSRENVRRAYVSATRRFASVLDELCAELPLLRAEMTRDAPLPASPIALRMDRAVRVLCGKRFITRLAAVAGSVADEVLVAMLANATLTKAFVNNGGDIALYLSPGAVFDVGMVGGLRDSRHGDAHRQHPHPEEARSAVSKDGPQPTISSFETPASIPAAAGIVTKSQVGQARLAVAPQDEARQGTGATAFGTLRLTHADPVRGIATSGFGGRSFSLGIADAVTILASNGAAADAAATLVANAVDLPDHPAVTRAPANEFDPQSDLGERLVTRAVGRLTASEIASALDAGVREAQRLIADGRIIAAALFLRGETRIIGTSAPAITENTFAYVV